MAHASRENIPHPGSKRGMFHHVLATGLSFPYLCSVFSTPMQTLRIYLDRNENNYGPAPACYDVLRRAGLSDLSVYSKAFSRGVKSDLSERLAGYFGLPESRVLLGYGAEDLLKQAIQCYLRAGEKLMVPTHSWWYYKSIAQEVDGENVEYPLVPGKDRFLYDVPAMLDIFRREHPKVVLISTPNNPTGNSLDRSDLHEVLRQMGGAMVILDEAYVFNGPPEEPRAIVETFPNVLVVRTFSKYYALAGLRIGYALMGEEFKRLAQSTNRYLGFNRLSEQIAIAALDSQDYYADIARKMTLDKERYYRDLGNLEGFTVYRSDANFLLAALPRAIMDPLKNHLTSRGIIIKFMNEELLNSHIRITIGTEEQNTLVIRAIQEFVQTSGR